MSGLQLRSGDPASASAASGPRPRRSRGWFLHDGPTILVALLLATFLLIFVLYPLLRVMIAPGVDTWSTVITSATLQEAALNTLIMGVLSTTSATVLGTIFGYALSRPDMPGRGLFRMATIVPLVSPPFVVGLSLLLLFGRRGLISHDLLGLDGGLSGLMGLWVVQTIAFFPIATLATAPMFRSLSASMEWAAWDSGYGWWGVFRRVTLPLAWPGILGAYMLIALYVLSDFGNPALVGRDFRVLSVEAYLYAVGRQDLNTAAVLCVFLFLPSVFLFLLQRRIQARRSFATVSGKGAPERGVPLPPLVRTAFIVVLGIPTLFIAVTYGAIIVGAFVQAWGANWTFTWDHVSAALLRGSDVRNSVVFALLASLLTVVVCAIAAYVNHRAKVPGSKLLDALAILPAAVPGTMIGISWLISFQNPPFALAGTAAILVLVMAVKTLPVGYRSTITTMYQVSPTLDDAARDLGYGKLRLFFRVIVPLVRPGLAVAFVFAFLNSLNTLSAVIFLVSPGLGLAAPTIINMSATGDWGGATGLAVLLMFVGIASIGLVSVLLRGRIRLFDI